MEKMSELEIIKVPLNDIDRILPQVNFGKMPILYLELLENKRKVRPDLINKTYEPREHSPEPTNETHSPHREDKTSSPHDESSPIRESEPKTNSGRSGEREPRDRDHERGENSHDPPKDEDIQEKLNNMLGEEADRRDDSDQPRPPTLKELQSRNPKKTILQKEYRYAQDEDEDVLKERNEVYFHYEVLKRMHPNATIPEFTTYSDPKVMAQKYDMLAKKLSLDSSVENWKRYMIIFVMGCEVALGKLNFDMEGFAQQQIMSMNTYDQLLVEMAEKSYVPSGKKWPVEVRLFMMLTMNVVLFVVSKMIMKKTGTNLLGTINDITNTAERKMKDPEAV